MKTIYLCLTLILTVVVSLVTDSCVRKAKEKRSAKTYMMVLLPILYYGILLWRYGLSMTAIKGFLFFLVLEYASASDIQSRRASDLVPLLLLLISMMDITVYQLPNRIIAILVAALPQIAVAVGKPGSWGGADIKVSAAGAAVLGLRNGLYAIIVGLLSSVFTTLILRKIKGRNENGIPMIPYFTLGFIIFYFV